MQVQVHVTVLTPVDEAVKRVGHSCADLLCAIQGADTVEQALVIHQRAELLIALCTDVSTAALRRADLVGNR